MACVSSASATQTLACAAATISGRASESRRAVARLIGKRRSVGSNGGALRLKLAARGDGSVAVVPSEPGAPAVGGGVAGTDSTSGLDLELENAGIDEGGSGEGNPGCWAAQGLDSAHETSKAAKDIQA